MVEKAQVSEPPPAHFTLGLVETPEDQSLPPFQRSRR